MPIHFQCSSVPLWNWLPTSVSRHCAILLHGYQGGQPSDREQAVTVGKKGTNPSNHVSGASAQIEQLMDCVNSMKLESPLRSASSTVWSHFCCQGIRTYIAQEKKREERKEKSSWRILSDDLCIQALPALCMVLILLIRLSVFGKKTPDLWCSTVYALHDKPLQCYKAKDQLILEVTSYH